MITTTTTISWPFTQHHPGEMAPEETLPLTSYPYGYKDLKFNQTKKQSTNILRINHHLVDH